MTWVATGAARANCGGGVLRFVPCCLLPSTSYVLAAAAAANDRRTFGRIRCGLIYSEAPRAQIHQRPARRMRGVGVEKGATLRLSFVAACHYSTLP